jgi:hypothetical protein
MNEPANQTPSPVRTVARGDVAAVEQLAAALVPGAAGLMGWNAAPGAFAGAINVRMLQPLLPLLGSLNGQGLRLLPRVVHQRHLLVAVVTDESVDGWAWDESAWAGPSGHSGWSM